MIFLIISLLLALAIISTLGWYCFKLTTKMLDLSSNLEDLYARLKEFDGHINFIYELEMYYGDETLKNLIRHSKDLRNYMSSFKDIIELTDETAFNEEDDDEQKEDESEQDEEKITRTGKAVFYSGS